MNQSGAQASARKASADRWLVWSFRGRIFAVELSRVFQVIERAEIFPVPLTSKNSSGVLYYQEEAIPVVNPEVLPGIEGGDEGTKILPELILLVEWDGYKVGIPVDRVIRVVEEFEIKESADDTSSLSGFPVEVLGMYEGETLYRLERDELLSALSGKL